MIGDPAAGVDRVAAETRFSGVVRVDRGGEVELTAAYGMADRANERPVTMATRFGIASGTKGLTALTVMRLVENEVITMATTARSLLGSDLPLIDGAVTVEHLLAHRSGIGDYLDEDLELDLDDYLLAVPVHLLATTEDYLVVLDGHATKFPPGRQFSYCNGGYVVLAMLAERAADAPFPELVARLVTEPAGMGATAFLRSDELPAGVALGYLAADGLRTNVLHLPVRGNGDGGIYTTVADVHALWSALFAGRVVAAETAAMMLAPRPGVDPVAPYGLGFWLRPETGAVFLEGCDAGVSFRSVHQAGSAITHTVISNTTDGAWPLTRHLDAVLGM